MRGKKEIRKLSEIKEEKKRESYSIKRETNERKVRIKEKEDKAEYK